jgi:hypothetical protein
MDGRVTVDATRAARNRWRSVLIEVEREPIPNQSITGHGCVVGGPADAMIDVMNKLGSMNDGPITHLPVANLNDPQPTIARPSDNVGSDELSINSLDRWTQGSDVIARVEALVGSCVRVRRDEHASTINPPRSELRPSKSSNDRMT